jgi:hypothetical protein
MWVASATLAVVLFCCCGGSVLLAALSPHTSTPNAAASQATATSVPDSDVVTPSGPTPIPTFSPTATPKPKPAATPNPNAGLDDYKTAVTLYSTIMGTDFGAVGDDCGTSDLATCRADV